jgi:hypothetical protein
MVAGWENARPHSLCFLESPLFQRDAKLGNHVPECVGGAEKSCAGRRSGRIVSRSAFRQ